MVLSRVRAEADSPLVQVGHTYHVAWSCLPQVGCYAEAMRVEKIREDGWVEVFQCQEESCRKGERWAVRLENAMSIRPFTAGKAAN